MAVLTDLEPLLSRLYEAALDPALWPAAWAEATAAAGMAPSLAVVADNGGAAPLAAPGWGRHTLKSVAVSEAGPAPYSRPDRGAAAPATEAERAAAAQLQVHLRRAVRMRARLATAQAMQAASSAALQAADTGVILVTAGGRIVYADPAAHRLASSVGLQLDSRRGALQTLRQFRGDTVSAGIGARRRRGGVGGDMLMRATTGPRWRSGYAGMTPDCRGRRRRGRRRRRAEAREVNCRPGPGDVAAPRPGAGQSASGRGVVRADAGGGGCGDRGCGGAARRGGRSRARRIGQHGAGAGALAVWQGGGARGAGTQPAVCAAGLEQHEVWGATERKT